MPSAPRSAVAPLYLIASLVLGGSAQGIWQNALLQLAGIAIIGWAAVEVSDEPLPRRAVPLLWLAIALVVLVILQDLPLPSSLWAHGPRTRIAEGYRLLGQPLPPLPVSLTPYALQSALLCLIPPLAIYCAIVRLGAYRASWLAAALLTGAVLNVLVGAVQVAGGERSGWYLYPETNLGVGVGFFANANHMATLLVIALPFVAAIAAAGKSRNVQRYSALLAVVAGAAIVLVVGIVLNGSLAGYTLLVPVLAASALIFLARGNPLRTWLAIAATVSALAAITALASSSIGGTKIGQDATTSVQSRAQILATTAKGIRDFMPLGSGLGSFPRVYRLYESPDLVTSEYVVHAHNDYVEVALELGLGGMVLMLVFLAWWTSTVWRTWRDGQSSPFARAASIACAAVLVHSLVDFPLRTAAISVCFAMSLALLAERRAPRQQQSGDLRPTRHLVVR